MTASTPKKQLELAFEVTSPDAPVALEEAPPASILSERMGEIDLVKILKRLGIHNGDCPIPVG